MKRSPLTRRTPLERTGRLKARSTRNKYRRRERFLAYLGWLKTLACVFAVFGDPCDGPIEAMHENRSIHRGKGQKADDRLSLPGCRRHHREPGAHVIQAWLAMTKAERWNWLDAQIDEHQARYAVMAGDAGAAA